MTTIIKAEQTARTTERILIKIYENILKQITLDADFPQYPDSLRMKYERLVYDVTRKAIETAHRAAIDYVGASLKVETFMTETDIQLIKVQTNTAVEQFFGSLRKACEAQQQADFKTFLDSLNNTQLYGAGLLDPITSFFSSVTRIAVSSISSAFGGATKQKTAQLTKHPSIEGVYIIEPGTGKGTGERAPPRITWIAQHDEKTCPYCLSQDGQIYEADDPSAPTPGVLDNDGNHPNCRCYYEVVPGYIYMEESPTTQSTNLNKIKWVGIGSGQQYQAQIVEIVGKEFGQDLVKVKILDPNIDEKLKQKLENKVFNINFLSDFKEY